MRIYYFDDEYEAGRHKIAKVWLESLDMVMPDASITAPYSVLEIDEFYNRDLAKLLLHNRQTSPEGDLPDRFYMDSDGKLRNNSDGSLIAINSNPQKESFRLSQLYGLTQQQLENYIENNINDLHSAKEFLKKVAAVVLWLVKQTNLDG